MIKLDLIEIRNLKVKMNKKKLSTNLIKGGINRSKFMETSDPLFLTSGFIYESAEEAEKSFKEEKKRFMYSVEISLFYILVNPF